MFFTLIGKIIAHLAFWFGAFRLGMGVGIASYIPGTEGHALASRYLAAATTGEAIDKGAICMLVGVALGVLCEISTKRVDTEIKP